jgi:hypothetical protein
MLTKVTLPPGAIGIALAMLFFGLFGPNTLLIFLAAFVMISGAGMLWRPGESPIFFFIFGFQWLQATIKLLQANWKGVGVQDLAEFRQGDVDTAIMLSLIGLFFLALGIRLAAGPWRPQDALRAKETVLGYAPKGFFKLYIIAVVTATLAQYSSGLLPGLNQPLLAFANLKWAFYWMLAYATFLRGSNFRYFVLALGLELTLSVGSYFSDFKTPLFMTLIAAATARIRLSVKQLFSIAIIAVLTLSLGVVWTAVKKDYRVIASKGGGQVISVDYSQRLAALQELIYELDDEAISDATEKFLDRLTYVDFFAVVLTYVPSIKPYERGALWQDAISRPFMPRLFFPNKARIEDSERTNYYTGLHKYGADKGTSISIGYIGESYIDFGHIGMMVPIFVLGMAAGLFYRWALHADPRRVLLGMALATATIYEMTFLEFSNAKLVGALVVNMLASWVVLRFVAPKYLPKLKSITG